MERMVQPRDQLDVALGGISEREIFILCLIFFQNGRWIFRTRWVWLYHLVMCSVVFHPSQTWMLPSHINFYFLWGNIFYFSSPDFCIPLRAECVHCFMQPCHSVQSASSRLELNSKHNAKVLVMFGPLLSQPMATQNTNKITIFSHFHPSSQWGHTNAM